MSGCAVFEAFRSIVTAEGVGGLYKGFWPTLMRDIPEIVIQVFKLLRVCCERGPLILTYTVASCQMLF